MKTHVICCGLPRSGSTLLYTMLRQGLGPGIKCPPQEMRADAALAPTKHLVTKKPKDVLRVTSILAACQRNGKRPKFVIHLRDMRSVLVSRHVRCRTQPCVGVEHSLHLGVSGVASLTEPGLAAYAAAIEALRLRDDLDRLVVRYEDLVTDPERERLRLEAFTGLPIGPGFLEMGTHEVPDPLQAPLNGVRPLDLSRLAPWRAGPNAAIVTRAFRLAPALLETLRAWGYADDDGWFDALAAETPEGLDDRPGQIVAYFTQGSLYEAEAHRLEASARALGLPIIVEQTPDLGSWLANTRAKPAILADARRRLAGPILYVDADAVLHRDPWPILRGYGQDVAVCCMRDGLVRAGTILLNDTPGARSFLADWRSRLEAGQELWDQTPLTEMLRASCDGSERRYAMGLLPVSLCYVFDRDPSKLSEPPDAPIIEHLQASREQIERIAIPGGPEKLALRRARLARFDVG